ncbi:SET domain-containing protein-lysine N-methyltransferase [Brenneria corticis]|uniref:SET domain-containing protein n=1 Tax=Brenneria corticis TaxID=2173106 RepID=A0A2U1U432_9GAMM|nr:SET domain-containing protein-lysine N-methyltransferase [Brenneria sp. CFCC 11842]PWC16415.1 hypothetical protein DDT56_10095 [Brenneria sp. CFCC 11842]
MKIGIQREESIFLAKDVSSGRGVFSKINIKSGSVIEVSLAVPIRPEEEGYIDKTIIWDYYFWTKSHLPNEVSNAHVLLGFASFCNHSISPNATIIWKKDGLGIWGILKAISDIYINEEITIHYANIDDYVMRGLISHKQAYGY